MMPDLRTDIRTQLFALGESHMRSFIARLLPNNPDEQILGVRKPKIDRLARDIQRKNLHLAYLQLLPHQYLEENMLHAQIINLHTDFAQTIDLLHLFLPCVSNWMVCDALSPKSLSQQRNELLKKTNEWLCSTHVYTIRFGIITRMRHFLGEDFHPSIFAQVAQLRHDDYYVRMAQAWCIAEALVFQWKDALPLLTSKDVVPWVRAKSIQKACESWRISAAQKEELRKLKHRK